MAPAPRLARYLLRPQIEAVSDLETAPSCRCGKQGSSKTGGHTDSSDGFEKITSLHQERPTEPDADRQ